MMLGSCSHGCLFNFAVMKHSENFAHHYASALNVIMDQALVCDVESLRFSGSDDL